MNAEIQRVRLLLEKVRDPEIPALSIIDMGIVRDVLVDESTCRVKITPTYSGCPAMAMIEQEIIDTLAAAGIPDPQVETVFSPAWTTEWMSEDVHRKLRECGIAPPGCRSEMDDGPFPGIAAEIICPYCDSSDTRLTSPFGTTACKSLHACNSCGQPFDHFKCI